MKTKILISLGIIIVLLIGLFITLKFLTPKKSPKQLELTYKINAGIPFRWEYEIEDESIVKFVKSYVVKDENKGAIVGAPVYTNYVFEGLKEGETTITFKFVNFTENTVSNKTKHYVKVDKNGNIFEIKQKK